MIMDIELIIFDLDGVLVETRDLHKTALNIALSEISNTKISDIEHSTIYNGRPTLEKLKMLEVVGRVCLDDIPAISKRKQEITVHLLDKNIVPDHQITDTLHYLYDKGYTLACYSNSIEKSIRTILSKMSIDVYFSTILSNDMLPIKPKPDPAGYSFLIKEEGLEPYQTLIVEDSELGFMAAYKSKAMVMLVSGPEEVNINRFRKINL